MGKQAQVERKNTIALTTILFVVLGMVALSFAAVPLYSLFCKVTGFGGTTQKVEANSSKVILDRMVTVSFYGDAAKNLPWDFGPVQASVDARIGEDNLVYYFAKNLSKKIVTGTAMFNVTPAKAGKYFNKTQCFCFDEQVLKPGEEAKMGISFYIDPAIVDDPNMDDVKNITLSYTFFHTDSKELDEEMEKLYN